MTQDAQEIELDVKRKKEGITSSASMPKTDSGLPPNYQGDLYSALSNPN